MADFEDALSPTWPKMIEGQINLMDYWAGQIDFTEEDTGKHYAIGPSPAILMVRPRGWHLSENHISVDGDKVAGAFVDFGLYFFHNAQAMLEPAAPAPISICRKPKAIWRRGFGTRCSCSQGRLGIPAGTIKATVLIETLPII